MTGIPRWVVPTASDGVEPALRLFCFPHAGGGTGLFHPWRALLGPEVDVCPVLLPGRESRLREPPAHRVEDLTGPLLDALLPLIDRPYALFGHSMGTIMAFELAQRLSALHWRRPAALIVSGRRAPHLPARHPPRSSLPDDEFLAAVATLGGTPSSVLAQPDLVRLFLPTLRADFALTEAYGVPADAAVLRCPVTVLLGEQDVEVDDREGAAWSVWTGAEFELNKFSGGHFFLADGRRDVITALRRALAATGNDVPAS